MSSWYTCLPTLVDLCAFGALGGMAQWGRVPGARYAPNIPEGVWPLATLGLMGLVARTLPCLVGKIFPGSTLETALVHNNVGLPLMALGLMGFAAMPWRQLRLFHRDMADGRGRKPWGVLLVATLPLAAGTPLWLMPPWAPDESLYHLSLTLHGLFAGGTWAPLGHGNGGFFSLGDHIAQMGLWMGSLSAARGAQIWCVVFGCEALWCLFPTLSTARVLAAQALFVSCPVVLWQLGCAYVDIMQAAFVLAAVALWARFCARPSGPNMRAWALCAWFVGCAVGCKVLALVWLPLFIFCLIFFGRERGLSLVLVGVCLLAPFAFDVLHNLLRYHTPLYPFGGPLWPGGEQLTMGQRQALKDFLALAGPRFDGVPLKGLWGLLATPFALVFAADFASPRFDGVVGLLPVLWVIAGSLGLWERRRGGAATAPKILLLGLLAAVLLPFLAWLTQSLQARFLIGPLWCMAWLTALSWPSGARFAALPARRARFTMLAAVLVLIVWHNLAQVLPHLPPMRLSLFGQNVAARRQARLLAVPASALCDALPHPQSHKTMLVWCQRLSLFCLGDQIADSYDEAAHLKEALQAADAAAVLRSYKVTHMLVHEGRTQADFSADLWRRYRAFAAQQLQVVATFGPYRLYRFIDGGDAQQY